jgi:phosphate-selective porin OprO/OprP
MKCFLKLGQKAIFKALTVTMLLGAFMVFMGGWACAGEKSVTEQILDILLQSHQISQEQYNDLLRKAEAEKMAEAQKILEAQKAAEAKIAAAPAVRKPTDFNAYWANGLRFTTDDKAFDIHIGGRAQVDFADAEPNGKLTNWAQGKYSKGFSEPQTDGYGDQLRRVRLDIDGTIWNNGEFITQIDFAPSYSSTSVLKSATLSSKTTKGVTTYSLTTATTSITQGNALSYADVWLGVKDIPYIGRIRAGQMYEPLSLEQMTSDNWVTFMEKSLPVNALIPGRNTGFEALNTAYDDRIGWMLGYFFQQQAATSSNGVYKDSTGDLFSPHLDATQIAGRVTGLPWYENNGERLLHVGVGYTHEFRSTSTLSTNPGTLDFKSSPEANMFNPLVDSGSFLAHGVDIVDPEIALVYGPFSLQGEYMWAQAQDIMSTAGKPLGTDHNASFTGWYAYASYFITGEHRPYNKTASPTDYQATFGRIIPNCNFNPLHGGTGAWEVAFKISQLDTNDTTAGFNGGVETDYTFGINWYLNPNMMVKMNFVRAEVDSHNTLTTGANAGYGLLPQASSDNIFETRFQVAF